jgi:hypothetical protein
LIGWVPTLRGQDRLDAIQSALEKDRDRLQRKHDLDRLRRRLELDISSKLMNLLG